MQIDSLVGEIVNRVMKAICLQRSKALILIPRMRVDVAEGLVRLIGSRAYRQAFDVLLPKAMPSEILKVFESHGLYVDKQFVSQESLDMSQYSELLVIDLHASLMREVVEIRPMTVFANAIIEGLEKEMKIQVVSCGFDHERSVKGKTPFIDVLSKDVATMKSWGIRFGRAENGRAYIAGRLITASDLVGYENKEVCIQTGAILTELARERAEKNGITIVR